MKKIAVTEIREYGTTWRNNEPNKGKSERERRIWLEKGKTMRLGEYSITLDNIEEDGIIITVRPMGESSDVVKMEHEFIPFPIREYGGTIVPINKSRSLDVRVNIYLRLEEPNNTVGHCVDVSEARWMKWEHKELKDRKGCSYCRALNMVVEADILPCECCPLSCLDKDYVHTYCNYFDLHYIDAEENWESTTLIKKKKYTDGMIAAGLTDSFPDFVEIPNGQSCSLFPKHWDDGSLQRVEAAYKFGARAYGHKYRKGTKIPYFIHPMETARIALSLDENPDVFIAALLHDVVEDTKYSERDIKDMFDTDIAELVMEETEDKMPKISPVDSWFERKERFLHKLTMASREAEIITLSDKLSNMRAIAKDYENIGEQVWERFNQKDARAQKWYYQSIAEQLRKFEDTKVWKEYNELIEKVF